MKKEGNGSWPQVGTGHTHRKQKTMPSDAKEDKTRPSGIKMLCILSARFNKGLGVLFKEVETDN